MSWHYKRSSASLGNDVDVSPGNVETLLKNRLLVLYPRLNFCLKLRSAKETSAHILYNRQYNTIQYTKAKAVSNDRIETIDTCTARRAPVGGRSHDGRGARARDLSPPSNHLGAAADVDVQSRYFYIATV